MTRQSRPWLRKKNLNPKPETRNHYPPVPSLNAKEMPVTPHFSRCTYTNAKEKNHGHRYVKRKKSRTLIDAKNARDAPLSIPPCVCMCTCVYVYVHVCECMYVYMNKNICTHVHVYISICTCTVHVHACVYMYILMYTYVYRDEEVSPGGDGKSLFRDCILTWERV